MENKKKTVLNVKQAVPFFNVTNMDDSCRFYVDRLGFEMKHQWTEAGKLRWCWLELDDVAIIGGDHRRKNHE